MRHASSSLQPLRRRLGLAAALAALTAAAPAPAAAQEPLRFGVFPWGAAGTTSEVAPSVPENADRSMEAVRALQGDRPLVVHVYGDYTGVSDASVDGLLSEASWWSANGLKVSAVLRYRPASAAKAAGYPAWVRTQVRRLAALTGTSSIHIGNEPNNLSPGAGDGSYPGVIGAIAAGVPAARSELDATGRPDVRVGFNWAAGSDPATTEPMWSQLRAAGGEAFTRAVGFVGVNLYPGTWSPPSASTVPTSAEIAATVHTTLEALRSRHLPTAGVAGADIVVGETGYPTSATRSEATQEMVLRTVIDHVEAFRGLYGVTDLYAFALRDGNTASGQLENGYGLLRDDYSAKPAFTAFRQAVARDGLVTVPEVPTLPGVTLPVLTPAPDPDAGTAPQPTAPAPEPTAPAPQPTAPAPQPTAPAPEPTVPAPEPDASSPAPAPKREKPRLKVKRARIIGRRTLDLLAPITRKASGTVRVTVRANGRTTRFRARIDSRRGRVRVRRSLPAAQRRARRATLTLEYAGNSRTLAQTVRARATTRRRP